MIHRDANLQMIVVEVLPEQESESEIWACVKKCFCCVRSAPVVPGLDMPAARHVHFEDTPRPGNVRRFQYREAPLQVGRVVQAISQEGAPWVIRVSRDCQENEIPFGVLVTSS